MEMEIVLMVLCGIITMFVLVQNHRVYSDIRKLKKISEEFNSVVMWQIDLENDDAINILHKLVSYTKIKFRKSILVIVRYVIRLYIYSIAFFMFFEVIREVLLSSQHMPQHIINGYVDIIVYSYFCFYLLYAVALSFSNFSKESPDTITKIQDRAYREQLLTPIVLCDHFRFLIYLSLSLMGTIGLLIIEDTISRLI